MAEFIPVPPFDLVVFGATGDLSLRKLFPSLLHRFLDGQIPQQSRIIGVARSEMDTDAFRKMVHEAHLKFDPKANIDEAKCDEFLKRVEYARVDATAPAAEWGALNAALANGNGNVRIFYLSTAPSLFVTIAQRLAEAGLATPTSRIVLEKPIGRDLASSRAINDGVGAVFDEHRTFRIDHYLGKETVQNLLVLRFANMLVEPLWSRATIDHVQITVAEELGVESRVEYYDKSGALRDMVQNHILQLLCLVALESPNSMDADAIRTEKLKVLSALRRIDAKDVAAKTVRGQYKAGLIGGARAPAYVEEVGKPTRTETFVAIKAEVDNWRWAGVPFYLRTGKRMGARRSEIVVQFKDTPVQIFGAGAGAPNRLVLRLQPDEGVRLWLNMKEPGPGGLRIKTAPLDLSFAEEFNVRYPDAYERLLMDIVRGNLSLFMRRDEVDAAWKWADALLAAWETSGHEPFLYPAGSNGPTQSALLMDRDGRAWWDPE
ncbi:glucose-6-phosphate dehydrogenase [Candidatus Viadribacter manganicus]|uniref:Glucose-6-phosphate 1-dehydrogenase n=1 Tax=Candidatus Viadribacter manganicus TaxID=1759059 RepID=A0A1B1AHR2_9PROT|nr:glucose-6-phosphate dehydrogenase [Candidatus Viadribacter manganicus]ANP46098.1 glucose-6-phosphate dehydrogenase [Candidatus Viadribacter manganicus]